MEYAKIIVLTSSTLNVTLNMTQMWDHRHCEYITFVHFLNDKYFCLTVGNFVNWYETLRFLSSWFKIFIFPNTLEKNSGHKSLRYSWKMCTTLASKTLQSYISMHAPIKNSWFAVCRVCICCIMVQTILLPALGMKMNYTVNENSRIWHQLPIQTGALWFWSPLNLIPK